MHDGIVEEWLRQRLNRKPYWMTKPAKKQVAAEHDDVKEHHLDKEVYMAQPTNHMHSAWKDDVAIAMAKCKDYIRAKP